METVIKTFVCVIDGTFESALNDLDVAVNNYRKKHNFVIITANDTLYSFASSNTSSPYYKTPHIGWCVVFKKSRRVFKKPA